MAEDQVDEQVESNQSFGEITQREDVDDDGGTPRLAKDTVIKSEDESEDSTDKDQGESQGEVDKTGESEESDGSEETQEDNQELTEKGTKLDKDPKSALHQQLANEKRLREQMTQVLGNPKLIAQFMKSQYNIDVPVEGDQKGKTEEVVEEVEEFKAEDFEDVDDVASKFNEMRKAFLERDKTKELKITELEGKINELINGGQRARIASNISQGVDSLRKAAELTPGSPDFIPGLEEKITEQFNKLDFDEATQSYRGQYSIDQVGKDLIDAIRMGRKAGSDKAQTIVKNKSQGQIKTSPKVSTEVDTDNMTPENSIAVGISKMFK